LEGWLKVVKGRWVAAMEVERGSVVRIAGSVGGSAKIEL
jgi:hypothetical protein